MRAGSGGGVEGKKRLLTQSTCLIRGIGHRVTTCRECFCNHWTHRVKPRRGGLLIFYNFFADGHMRGAQDDYSLHLGCEVRGGEKVRLRILHPLICVVSAFVCAALDLVNNICSPVIPFSALVPLTDGGKLLVYVGW